MRSSAELADEVEICGRVSGLVQAGRGGELARRLLGDEVGVFCCHMVPPRGPGVWYRYAMLPRPPGEVDVEARSHAAGSAVLICARLERQGQEAPPELRAMAVRVLAEGGVRWVGGAL